MERIYYRATNPDGRDFATGTIDYGAALVSDAGFAGIVGR